MTVTGGINVADTPAHPLLRSPHPTVKKGDRVAQLILEKITTPPVVEVRATHGCHCSCTHNHGTWIMPCAHFSNPARRWRTWTTPPVEQVGSAARE